MRVLGRKDDAGKPRWSLLPWRALGAVVQVMEFGARKYEPNAWQHVPEARERYFDAAMRHLVEWHEDRWDDAESGLPHLAHAACCVLFLLWFDLVAKDDADRFDADASTPERSQ